MKTLVKNQRGRYCIVEKELTCGSVIYAYIKGEGWCLGRIEYADSKGGYYFLCESKKFFARLDEDLEVRTLAEQEELIREARALEVRTVAEQEELIREAAE
jgi:hypothetical protein